MKKVVALGLVALACASCDRWFHRGAPKEEVVVEAPEPKPSVTPMIVPHDGGLSPSALAALLGEDEEEQPTTSDAGATCPLPIHPNYCRRRCRNFATREATKHASRVPHALRAGTGTCGAFKVFAEDQKSEDGGSAGGIVEYFEGSGALVGAEDSRRKPCGTYGTIPKCKLEIQWGPPRGLGLGDLR